MGLITGQKLTNYYELFKDISITFNKDVIATTGIQNNQIFLKCLGEQWRCIPYSTSMVEAKVISSLSKDQFEKITKANNIVSLRFSFDRGDKAGPVTFFIASKITGFNAYNKDNPDLNIVSVSYTQRPPDDHIAIIGALIDANVNAKRRKDERIELTAETVKLLTLKSVSTILFINQIPRKAILRDISFSGAKIIIPGVGKLLLNQTGILKMPFESEQIDMQVKIVRYEEFKGRKDLTILAIEFDLESIPMGYKIKLNNFLDQIRLKKRSVPE